MDSNPSFFYVPAPIKNGERVNSDKLLTINDNEQVFPSINFQQLQQETQPNIPLASPSLLHSVSPIMPGINLLPSASVPINQTILTSKPTSTQKIPSNIPITIQASYTNLPRSQHLQKQSMNTLGLTGGTSPLKRKRLDNQKSQQQIPTSSAQPIAVEMSPFALPPVAMPNASLSSSPNLFMPSSTGLRLPALQNSYYLENSATPPTNVNLSVNNSNGRSPLINGTLPPVAASNLTHTANKPTPRQQLLLTQLSHIAASMNISPQELLRAAQQGCLPPQIMQILLAANSPLYLNQTHSVGPTSSAPTNQYTMPTNRPVALHPQSHISPQVSNSLAFMPSSLPGENNKQSPQSSASIFDQSVSQTKSAIYTPIPKSDWEKAFTASLNARVNAGGFYECCKRQLWSIPNRFVQSRPSVDLKQIYSAYLLPLEEVLFPGMSQRTYASQSINPITQHLTNQIPSPGIVSSAKSSEQIKQQDRRCNEDLLMEDSTFPPATQLLLAPTQSTQQPSITTRQAEDVENAASSSQFSSDPVDTCIKAYIPMALTIDTHGGLDVKALMNEWKPTRRKTRESLGPINITTIILQLRSRLPVEVTNAINTLTVLTSDSHFTLDLRLSGDLLKVVIETFIWSTHASKLHSQNDCCKEDQAPSTVAGFDEIFAAETTALFHHAESISDEQTDADDLAVACGIVLRNASFGEGNRELMAGTPQLWDAVDVMLRIGHRNTKSSEASFTQKNDEISPVFVHHGEENTWLGRAIEHRKNALVIICNITITEQQGSKHVFLAPSKPSTQRLFDALADAMSISYSFYRFISIYAVSHIVLSPNTHTAISALEPGSISRVIRGVISILPVNIFRWDEVEDQTDWQAWAAGTVILSELAEIGGHVLEEMVRVPNFIPNLMNLLASNVWSQSFFWEYKVRILNVLLCLVAGSKVGKEKVGKYESSLIKLGNGGGIVHNGKHDQVIAALAIEIVLALKCEE